MRRVVFSTREWLEQRTGLPSAAAHFLREDIPASSGWPQVFGSIALFLFLTQALTGILLALNYAATPGEAYDSVDYILHEVAGGRIVHGLHHWGASWMIVVVCLHMAQVFIYGAFKKPREATWIAGVLLLLLTLAFGLTGYLLPWDNKAYWGTMVTTKILAGMPGAGSFLTRLIGATDRVGVVTFSRFYALHTLVLPATTILLIGLHVYLVRLHGITPSPSDHGKKETFYPKQLFRDFAAVFLVFLSLFLAAVFLDVPLERMADPTDTTYVPRPEWYFLFLFQLLKIFPGRFELIGTMVLPSVTILTLIFLPFWKGVQKVVLNGRLQAACVTVLAFSIWFGLTAAAGFTGPHPRRDKAVPKEAAEWARVSPEEIAGLGYFRSLQCGSCHNLLRGAPKPGPTLGVAGLEHSKEWMVRHFRQPAETPSKLQEVDSGQTKMLLAFVTSLKPKSIQSLEAMSPTFVSGAQIYISKGCSGCHKVNGTGGSIGPSLDGLPSRHSKEWVQAHFLAPQKLSPGSIMPPYRFSTDEEKNLLVYLFSLSE
ncbi:MAG TPA: cytochrome b N-terminal domain-containing protein [Bryobacteraceae bacterium]|jgi:ubiquinol-cytochrome c reductase cytochrome b subunit|nr:cytochrome b N-terminal domain-containing protein [Bryobacteraceae bacterium]